MKRRDMSLNWNIKNVPAWDEIDGYKKDTVLCATMWLDMGEITEDNYMEWCDRSRIYIALHQRSAEDWKFLSDPEFMKQMIGLRVNVVTKTMRKWFSTQYKLVEHSRKYDKQQTKEE